MHKLQGRTHTHTNTYVKHYIAIQSDLIAFTAILAIYKEYHWIPHKKNKQIQENQEHQQKLRMNWHIPNQSGGSQDKFEKNSPVKKELQSSCHGLLSSEKIKKNKKECKRHATGKNKKRRNAWCVPRKRMGELADLRISTPFHIFSPNI